MHNFKIFVSVIIATFILSGSSADAGLSGSLDKELTSLIEKTEPYLVTVKGDGTWRNLIATGIVYNEEGYVITSSPAYMAADFEVTFANGESYDAEPVGVDHETGLALLRIKGKRQFQVPAWGSPSKLDKGSWILFVGNSYDTPSSVNIGTYKGKDDEGLLELNLNVNPGSSGGAVLNTDGEVIGILIAVEFSPGTKKFFRHNMKFGDYYLSKDRGRSGETALALPIEQARDIVEQLIEHGEIKRGFLGINQKNLTDEQKRENNIDGGIMVTDVVDDSPADKAGLREDDIIVKIDGKSIEGIGDLYSTIRSHKPGDRVNITYIRDGKTKRIDVELGESERDYFLGSLDFDGILPKLKIDNKLDLPRMENLEEELQSLRDELEKLRYQLDGLKDDLKK
ncbi:MAG: PDZ domain-containing protein [Candidatus Zixiibacteriota bacterium]|nr:MAG: PDZ domain-containing protein [candidate division Zixibacteria bacterium]